MLVPIKLLSNAFDDIPGDVVPVNAWTDVRQMVTELSSDFNYGDGTTVALEWAESPSGPWEGLIGRVFNSGPQPQGVIVSNLSNQRMFIGYVRARLVGPNFPLHGSVSVSLYADVR